MSPHGVIAIPMSVFCATATRSVNRAPVSSINILRWHGILRQQNLCPHLPRLIDMIVYKRLFGIDSRLLDRMAVAICPPFVTQVWQVDVLIFMLPSTRPMNVRWGMPGLMLPKRSQNVLSVYRAAMASPFA